MISSAIHALLDALADMPAFLARAFRHVPDHCLRQGSADDQSPLLEHVWHLHDCDADLYGMRIRRVLAEDDPFLEPMSVNHWPAERRYLERPLQPGLQAFTAYRLALVDELRALAPGQLGRTGRRADGRRSTVLDLIGELLDHDQDHRLRIVGLLGFLLGATARPAQGALPLSGALPPAAPPFPTLETARLRLRELVAGDAGALFAIHGDAEAMRWFGTDPLPDLAEAAKLVERFASWRSLPNPGVRWGIEDKASGRLLGTCGLFAWNREWRKCATGYELAPDVRGRGLMHEALAAAFDWGFAQMQLHRIEAQIHPDNTASLRLAERLGFRHEGRLREVGRWGGQFHDLQQFGLLQRDWVAGRAGA